MHGLVYFLKSLCMTHTLTHAYNSMGMFFLGIYARQGLASCFILICLGCCRTTILYNSAKCSLSTLFYMHVWFQTHTNQAQSL
jgi:hypothetical protein